MTHTMRAVDIRNGKGPAEALFINNAAPMPKAKPADAIVRTKAFGLNRMDTSQREGNYPVPPQAPKTLGVEFSGVIEQAAEKGEADFNVGDEVFGLAYGGAYAQYIAISTKMLIHKPKELSWEEAAGIPETWITATQAMYLIGEFSAGKSILWHAGASAVSLSGIQLARHNGASSIYVTASSQEKIDFCVRECGATAGFNYKTQDWAKEILNATDGKGVDVIVDYIGGPYFAKNLEAAARDGRIVQLAFLGGTTTPEPVNILPLLLKRLRVEGSSLRSRDEKYQGRLRDMLVEHALPKFVNGEFKIFVERVFPWDQIVEAHKLIESNQTKGKIICTIG